MFQLIANALAWFYGLVPNYAIAIALLTLAIMVLLTPLTLKGTKSMLEVQRLQPEMKRLQAQYKGDRQALNEEMMKLYREHKINPLGGCLPLLLQLPIFFILYRVLRKLTETCTADDVLKGISRCVGVKPGNFGPSYVDHSTQLWKDLSSGNTMMAFGLDLARSAVDVIRDSFVKGLPYLVLVLIVAATSYYQQRQIASRTKNQPVNPQQQMLLKVMPALFAVISLTFPAGLIVYFLTSNMYRIGQQAYITKRFYRADKAGGGGDGSGNGALPKGKPPPGGSDQTTKDGGPPTRPSPERPKPKPKRPEPTVKPDKAASPARGPAARPPSRPRPQPAPKRKS
jgi:YidC/Oxa1 family membrane protein insertase